MNFGGNLEASFDGRILKPVQPFFLRHPSHKYREFEMDGWRLLSRLKISNLSYSYLKVRTLSWCTYCSSWLLVASMIIDYFEILYLPLYSYFARTHTDTLWRSYLCSEGQCVTCGRILEGKGLHLRALQNASLMAFCHRLSHYCVRVIRAVVVVIQLRVRYLMVITVQL